MNINILQSRELDETKSLEIIESEMKCLEQKKTKLLKKKENRQTFLNNVTEWGYGSPTEFLIEMGYFPNPSVKKTRTVISKEVREKIITDLKNKVPTKEISSTYGVTDDTVYNIKGEEGLTKPKTKKVPTTTTVTTPTVTVSPTTDNPSTVQTTTVSDSDKTLTPSVI